MKQALETRNRMILYQAVLRIAAVRQGPEKPTVRIRVRTLRKAFP